MSDKKLTVALAGNPNAGKTTLFNALTGMRNHVGNWPGKTVSVERMEGKAEYNGYTFEIVDLPGTYSLFSRALDEEIAAEYYEAAYGADGAKLYPLMEQISSLFSPDYLIGIGDRFNPDLAERLRQVPVLLDQVTALQKDHALVQYAAQMHMWQELDFFVSYTRLLAHITELLADGHAQEAKDLFITQFEPMVQRHELIDQSGLDVYRSLLILGRTFKK